MSNSNRFALLLMLGFATSCGESLTGTIVRRSGGVYLVNSSKFTPYQFTIRQQKMAEDSVCESNTFLQILAPGEEVFLGTEQAIGESKYPIIRDTIRLIDLDSAFVFDLYKTKMKFPVYDQEHHMKEPTNKRKKTFEDAITEFENQQKKEKIYIENDEKVIEDTDKHNIVYLVKEWSDLHHPFPRIRYSYVFAVTGQLKLKSDLKFQPE